MLINDQTLTQLNKHISSTLHSHFDLKQNHFVSQAYKKESQKPFWFSCAEIFISNYAQTLLGLDVSRCRTRVTSETNTIPAHNFTELCDFIKLFAVSVSVSCPMSVSVSVLNRSVQISKQKFHSQRSYIHKLYNEVPYRCVIKVNFPLPYTQKVLQPLALS